MSGAAEGAAEVEASSVPLARTQEFGSSGAAGDRPRLVAPGPAILVPATTDEPIGLGTWLNSERNSRLDEGSGA
jgi:hypothetical protein